MANDDNFLRNKITTISGIMCILVVFLHSENIVDKYGSSINRGIILFEFFISRSLGDLAVPTFFFMSAILFFQNFDLSKMGTKYKSRISSVVIPYLLWNFLYMIFLYILVNNPLSNALIETKEITINAKVVIDSVLFYQYNNVYWYMYQLILFILISPVVYIVMKNPYGILIVPMLIIINYWFYNIPEITYGIKIKYLIYWLLGAYFVIHIREQIYRRSSRRKLYLALPLSLALIIVRFYLEFVNQELEVSEYVLSLLILANVIAVWFALDVLKFNSVHRWMQMSFFIYSIHPLIVWTIKDIISVLLPPNGIIVLANYMIAGMGGVVISICIAKILRRFTPKIYCVLTGGR